MSISQMIKKKYYKITSDNNIQNCMFRYSNKKTR